MRNVIDAATFSNLVRKAMGNRSASRFAKELGVATTTVTRILNGERTGAKNKRASSLKLLYEIAAHSEGRVTYEELLQANEYPVSSEIPIETVLGLEALIPGITKMFPDCVIKKYVQVEDELLEEKNYWHVDLVVENASDGLWVIDMENIVPRIFKKNTKYTNMDYRMNPSTLFDPMDVDRISDVILTKMVTYALREKKIEGKIIDRYSLLIDDYEVYKKAEEWLKQTRLPAAVTVIYFKAVLDEIKEIEECTCCNLEGEQYPCLFG